MAKRPFWYQRFFDWLFAHIAPPVFVFVLRALYATMRWEIVGRENLAPFWDEGRPFIMAFWHGRLLLMPHLWERKGNAHVLIGFHRNGELIARMIAPFGIGAVRGWHRAGGKEALQKLAEAYFEGGGQTLGFTPDGPHGPRYVSKMGMAQLSRKFNIPILWASTSANPCLRLPVWDRFLIPLPFSKAYVHWAPAVDPADYAHLDLEGYRDAIDELGRKYLVAADQHLALDPEDIRVDGAVRA